MGTKTIKKNGKEIQIFYGEDDLIENTWVKVIDGPLPRQVNEDAPQIKIIFPEDMLVSWMEKIGKVK